MDGELWIEEQNESLRIIYGDDKWRKQLGSIFPWKLDRAGQTLRVLNTNCWIRFSVRYLRPSLAQVFIWDVTEVHMLSLRNQWIETGMLDGFWDMDLINGKEYYSPRFWKILGYEPEEKIHENRPEAWRELIHPDDLKVALNQFEHHISTHGRAPFNLEARYIHPNTNWCVWVICKGQVIEWDIDGTTPIRMVGTHTDITEQKIAQLQLKKDRAAACQQVQLNRQFLSRMSHEIRSPLHAIMAILDMEHQNMVPKHQRTEMLDIALQHCRHISMIINDVLDINHIQSGRGVSLNIQGHNWKDVNIEIKSCFNGVNGNVFKFDGLNSELKLFIDKVRVKQVILNLISNSARFTTNGHIYLKSHYDPSQNLMCVRVIDTGSGIDKEILGTIFEESITTKGGHGFGLPLSRILARCMGGDLKCIDSSPGSTTFEFSFHTTEPHRVTPVKDKLRHTSLAMYATKLKDLNLRVLVLDDSPVNCKILKMYLKHICNVEMFTSGQEALERFEQVKGAVDVLFVDVHMPNMDGWEVMNRLSKLSCFNSSKTNVFILTGDVLELTLSKDCIASAIITKPATRTSILKHLAKAYTGKLKE